MSRIEIDGVDSIGIGRNDNTFPARLLLTITGADGTVIEIDCGYHGGDMEELNSLLQTLAKESASLLKNWEDQPDAEEDGFISFSGGAYYVTLSGTQVGYGLLPSREIATIELARALAEDGYFPNVWYENDRGITEAIHEEVRAYHDEGGDKMKPLEGVEYEDGAAILVDGLGAYVIRDYGKAGIVYVLAGDDWRRLVEDRSTITPLPEEDEDA